MTPYSDSMTLASVGDVKDIRHYIKPGPLARVSSSERSVLLIDEVDKADLEFPNDLLHELDRMRYVVTETGDEVIAAIDLSS